MIWKVIIIIAVILEIFKIWVIAGIGDKLSDIKRRLDND